MAWWGEAWSNFSCLQGDVSVGSCIRAARSLCEFFVLGKVVSAIWGLGVDAMFVFGLCIVR